VVATFLLAIELNPPSCGQSSWFLTDELGAYFPRTIFYYLLGDHLVKAVVEVSYIQLNA
jgi:hypothetical protein